MEFLEWSFYGNTARTWAIALGVTVSGIALFYLFKAIIIRRATVLAATTSTEVDDWVVDLLKRTHFFFLLIVALYAASLTLTLPAGISRLVNKVVIIAFFIQTALWGSGLISVWVERYKRRQSEMEAGDVTAVVAFSFVARLILWSIILLLVLDNVGVEITALVAGLGIGGIAVGLAVQNILGDLFASMSIVLDKPFKIGDFVIVDDKMGTVENVGLKTTRMRSLTGEQLVVSNSDLLQSRLHNYKRMDERRVVFSIGVTYQTPYEQLEAIPGMIREIIEAQDQVRFDRAHFKEFGDFSLNFEIVYYVLDPDYALYMDIQQAINLALFRRFAQEGIEFAYPTQSLHLEGKVVTDFRRNAGPDQPSSNNSDLEAKGVSSHS